MEKVCVFCGNTPRVKSREHVLPQWLIELTGDPKRTGFFGYDKSGGFTPRLFSFDQFCLPSCSDCNAEFSKLEGDVKPIISKLLSEDKIGAAEFNTLLDWFDKIRIGIWLAFYYLDKNFVGVSPKFYIKRRLAASDRMLLVAERRERDLHLNFFGCETLSFHYRPSCFLLLVNHLWFLNISENLLFARRAGFPYVETRYWGSDYNLGGKLVEGRERMMAPLLGKHFGVKGTEIYQPIFRQQIEHEGNRKYYETDYVRKQSMNWGKGLGKMFIQILRSFFWMTSESSSMGNSTPR
jgi:hypothetical protein